MKNSIFNAISFRSDNIQTSGPNFTGSLPLEVCSQEEFHFVVYITWLKISPRTGIFIDRL
jgi:hypothetical protein